MANEDGGPFGGRFSPVRRLKSCPGGETLLGTDLTDGGEVVIRTVSGPAIPTAQAGFEREVDDLRRLWGAAGGPLAAGRHGGSLYFVMPFIPGITLEARLAAAPMSLRDALTVGRSVTRDLVTAHGLGVLHRDVRPSNVIVEPAAGTIGRATLGDFGVAQLARVGGTIPESRLRTARYASPEAAGLVSYQVDERSDLYSAGAMLFECLGGRPLFQGETVGEVLRQQLTQPVPLLRSLGIPVPGALDEVLQRLLMKEPGDRYSSARAVLADLGQIAGALESDHPGPAVVVGGQDNRGTLAQPAFVGRNTELGMIEAEFDRARAGQGGLVLVEAESGGGKTRLLEEVAQRGAEHGIWVLRGQGVDQTAQLPLNVLDGVVDEVLRRAQADATFAPAIRHALGPQLRSLVDAIPRLAGIFGSAGTGSLGPEAYGEARSVPALTMFLDALGAAGPGVVIVLDDCQWADELTVKLIAHWAGHPSEGPGMRRVVLVAAFRTEEVAGHHPLRRTRPAAHVVLPALSHDETRGVLVSMAGPLPDEAVAVVERLCEGNPFMATAVLRGLVETGALVQEPAGWRAGGSSLPPWPTYRPPATPPPSWSAASSCYPSRRGTSCRSVLSWARSSTSGGRPHSPGRPGRRRPMPWTWRAAATSSGQRARGAASSTTRSARHCSASSLRPTVGPCTGRPPSPSRPTTVNETSKPPTTSTPPGTRPRLSLTPWPPLIGPGPSTPWRSRSVTTESRSGAPPRPRRPSDGGRPRAWATSSCCGAAMRRRPGSCGSPPS